MYTESFHSNASLAIFQTRARQIFVHEQPVDVCVRLAALTSGKANLLPAPFVVDDQAACDVILQQRLVKETLETARRADYAITSVGECRDDAVLFESSLFTTEQIDQLRDNNVVADCCGVFFTADGTVAGIPLNGCTPCAKPNEMPDTDMTLLAGGLSKRVGTLAAVSYTHLRAHET